MTVVAVVPAAVALAGALVYALASNAKVAELARLAFACGLLVFMFSLARDVVKL